MANTLGLEKNAGPLGVWMHSHEEDAPGETVYRPEGYPMPPSRGRSTLSIEPDGLFTRKLVGADDRPGAGATSTGRWQPTAAGEIELTLPSQGRVVVKEAGPDKLVLKNLSKCP